jgi:hypothetical protein
MSIKTISFLIVLPAGISYINLFIMSFAEIAEAQ